MYAPFFSALHVTSIPVMKELALEVPYLYLKQFVALLLVNIPIFA